MLWIQWVLFVCYVLCMHLYIYAQHTDVTDTIDVSYPVAEKSDIEQAKKQWLERFIAHYPGSALGILDIQHYVTSIDSAGQKQLTVTLPYSILSNPSQAKKSISAWVGAVQCSAEDTAKLSSMLGADILVKSMPSDSVFSDDLMQKSPWKDVQVQYPGVPFYYVQCMQDTVIWHTAHQPIIHCAWDKSCFPLQAQVEIAASEVHVMVPLQHGKDAADMLIALNNISGVEHAEIIQVRQGIYTFSLQLKGITIQNVDVFHNIRAINDTTYEVVWTSDDYPRAE